MKTKIQWNQKMSFTGSIESGDGAVTVAIDSKPPLGLGQGFTPKALVAVGLAGCTGMDVIALLTKNKEPVASFTVDTEVEHSSGSYPVVFKSVVLKFFVTGSVRPEKLIEAVTLSQTRYCGVSAMLAKAVPIRYEIFLNELKISEGSSNFSNFA